MNPAEYLTKSGLLAHTHKQHQNTASQRHDHLFAYARIRIEFV